MGSFVPVPEGSHFPLENLPYGVFRPCEGASARIGVAIGDHILDLSALVDAGLLTDGPLQGASYFKESSLNSFMAKGRSIWRAAREVITKLLTDEAGPLRDDKDLRVKALMPMEQAIMELPAQIGDYTDFYASREHATNVGTLFRGKDNALPANWLHVPIGYHGRASSVVISGTPVARPWGQMSPPHGESQPVFKPSAVLDFEMEMALFVGPGNELGSPVSLEEAKEHIFGVVLMNDWSARDIQKWEYVPLGPFLAKNFATTISPWIVTLEALEPFLCSAKEQELEVLPYLREEKRSTYDIKLEVAVKPAGAKQATTVTRTNFNHLYWTMSQQLAHHTVSGCNLRPGDLLASGTISGQDRGSLGSLLEMTEGGKLEITMEEGGPRKYLQDGDEVIMTGYCQADSLRLGFGTCRGLVLPAKTNIGQLK